jgi:hypothetical protein
MASPSPPGKSRSFPQVSRPSAFHRPTGFFLPQRKPTESNLSESSAALPDDAAWRKFVTSALDNNITHWEVLDSFNLGPRQQNTPFRYVEYLTIARKAASGAKIG